MTVATSKSNLSRLVCPNMLLKMSNLASIDQIKRSHVSGHIHRCALSWWQCWRKDGECRVQ